jgi:hypothetical protein
MKSKKNLPSCATKTEHRGEKTREGAKSVAGLLERMKHGGGINDLDDKSRGMEILMVEAFAKINPTDPLILAKQAT